MIAAGEAEVVVAGGMESMSKAPHLLNGARAGVGFGDTTLVDDIVVDGLSCAFDQLSMGTATERDSTAASITREEQDAVAVRSHDRASAATKAGRLSEEIVPVSVPRRRGEPILVLEDEGIRPGTTHEQLAGLPSAFSDGGAITAGNASRDLRWSGRPRRCFSRGGGSPRDPPAGGTGFLRRGCRTGHVLVDPAVSRHNDSPGASRPGRQ